MNDKHMIDDSLSLEELQHKFLNDIDIINDNTNPTQSTTQNQRASQSSEDTTPHAQQDTDDIQASSVSQYVRHYSHRSCAELCRKREPIPQLIKGYIRQRGLGMIYGESGCGKSFTVIDMAASIACNDITTWNGKSIHHGPVVYFAGEGADGLNARLACWCNERNINPESVQLEIIDEIFKLDCGKEDTTHSLENTIAEIKATFQNTALVVLDTLNVFMKSDENSNTEAGNFCALCRKIIQECGCTVLIVHHTGLNPEAKKRGRGASALKGAMDFELQLTKSGDILTLSTPKIKDGKEQPELLFKLKQHEIPDWFDEDGEPVTSCTIELAEEIMQYREARAEAKSKEKEKPKYPDSVVFGLKVYREAAKLHGQIITDNPETGHEFIRLGVNDWRNTFYQQSSADNDNAKKQAFRRARKDITEKFDILTIQREDGYEYYCLDMSGNTEPAYRLEIRTAIKNREKSQGENGATTQATGTDNQADTTQNLF